MTQKTINHHPFPNGVHVEVIIDEGNGEISTRSVEFDVADEDVELLRPREKMPDSELDDIMEYLNESGYEVENIPITS